MATIVEAHPTGTREEWLKARLDLLKAEKELTRRSDEVARQRQELPWVRVDKDYRFDTDEGRASLFDLFRGRSQLLVYHFMFGPDYAAGAKHALTERWIDMYPTEGKASGAYSNGGAYDVHPYMLLNYNGRYEDMGTLAHELGHHVQHLLGTDAKARQLQQSNPDEANQASVALELQADCYAGVWGHYAQRGGALDAGDAQRCPGAGHEQEPGERQRSEREPVQRQSRERRAELRQQTGEEDGHLRIGEVVDHPLPVCRSGPRRAAGASAGEEHGEAEPGQVGRAEQSERLERGPRCDEDRRDAGGGRQHPDELPADDPERGRGPTSARDAVPYRQREIGAGRDDHDERDEQERHGFRTIASATMPAAARSRIGHTFRPRWRRLK